MEEGEGQEEERQREIQMDEWRESGSRKTDGGSKKNDEGE